MKELDSSECMSKALEVPVSESSASAGSLAKTILQVLQRRTVTLLVLNVAVILVVSRLTPYFLTRTNFEVMLRAIALEAVITAAMAILLVAGMLDLSVDGVWVLCGLLAGLMMNRGMSVWQAVLLSLVAGTVVGLLNGLCVTKVGMNPMMTTMGTWWLTLGTCFGVTEGHISTGFVPQFSQLAQAKVLNIPMYYWYPFILCPILAWLLSKAKFGAHVYATGGNAEAARLHGVKVDRVVIASFMMTAFSAALGGIVFASRVHVATCSAVSGMNLRVMAGAIVGGCALAGGEGNVVGAVLGLFFLNLLTNAATMLGISAYWQHTMLGVVLVVAVAADAIIGGKSRSAFPG